MASPRAMEPRASELASFFPGTRSAMHRSIIYDYWYYVLITPVYSRPSASECEW